MKVHNVYSDILLSLSYFLNKILNNQIQNFQYNIGSTSFVLDYNPNYKFPAAIINYENSTYSNARPNTFLRPFNNINQIPVLYNKDKDILLKIQEDLFNVSVEIIINCDSQYQSINFKHVIESLMPLNKYLQLYEFTSYFELDSFYNNAFLFDVNNDDIENLVFKLDRITNELKYFFTVSYQPLIRLNSSNIGLQDISSSNFALTLNFDLLMQLPSKVLFSYQSEQQQQYNFNAVKLLKHDNIIVPVNVNNDHVQIKVKDESNNLHVVNCPCNIVNNELTGSYNSDATKNIVINSSVTNETIEGKVFGEFDNQIITEAFVTINTGSENIKYGTITGKDISGKLKSIEIDSENDKLTAWFEGEFFNSIIKSKIENINYKLEKTTINTNKLSINSESKVLAYNFINTANIFASIKNINFVRNEINTDLTKITGLRFYDKSAKKYLELYELMNPVDLSPDGAFSFLYNLTKINGSIDLKLGNVLISAVRNPDPNFDLELHELVFNLIFNYYPIRGPGQVQQINIDFNIANNTVSDISPISLNNYSSKKISLVLDSIDDLNLSEKDSNNRYSFSIPLPEFNSNISNEYSFFFTKDRYLTDQHRLEIILDDSKSSANLLVFSMTEETYYKYFLSVDKLYPLFFSTPLIR